MILGTFIIVYDYPQIEYFNDLEKQTFTKWNSNDFVELQILENGKREIYQKILIEFLVGIIFFGIGIMLILISIFKRFKNGFR
jgi:hypothetical protein